MPFRLRELHPGARLGLTGLLLAMTLGLVTAALHLVRHYENRDERPGLTLDDIRAAYRGLDEPAPILSALRRNHPGGLSAPSRELLEKWLTSARVAEDFDSLDLGDESPSETIAASCVSCHARSSTDAKGRAIPLETWDDVKKQAFARRVNPNPLSVIIASAHAHAPTMGLIGLALALLAVGTRWARSLIGALIALMGLGLIADVGSWFLARENDVFVPVIVGAGAAFNLAAGLLILLIVVDLWAPSRTKRAA